MRLNNNVLLVDDDTMSNKINEKIIQISRFELKVNSFLDGRAALDYLRQLIKTDRIQFPNAIFLDINMPEMDGWEFIEELNKLPPFVLGNCRVFLLTSSIDQEDIERSQPYEIVNGFISKPLTIADIETIFSLRLNRVNKVA